MVFQRWRCDDICTVWQFKTHPPYIGRDVRSGVGCHAFHWIGITKPVLLNVVVTEGASILQLLPGKDQALLVWRDTCHGPRRTSSMTTWLYVDGYPVPSSCQQRAIRRMVFPPFISQIWSTISKTRTCTWSPKNPVQPKMNMFPSTAPAMIGTAGRTFLVLNLRLHIVDGIRGFHVLTPGIEIPSLQETVECHRKVYEN